MSDDVRHERSLILLLSILDPDIVRQRRLTVYEIDVIKNLALEKLHRQRILKEHVAMFFFKNYNWKSIFCLINEYIFKVEK